MKKCILYVESLSQMDGLIRCAAANVEIIIGCLELSRYSKCTLEEMLEIKNLAHKNNIPVVLEWDALNQEEKFQQTLTLVDRLPLHDFKALRLQDPGAVEYIKNKYPWMKIQIILENGNHNLVGLSKWVEYLGEQCERLVLSNELSREMLREYASKLSTPIEVLVYGRILLFYSPRKLLSPIETKSIQEASQFIEAFGTSEESPHSGFPLIENRHGTYMFNVKDLYLLDHLDELKDMGIVHTRVDLRFDDSVNFLPSVLKLYAGELSESMLPIKSNPIRPLIKGFYNINKTDVLFTKLKNKRTQRTDQNYIGEIVDVERDSQLALLIKTTNLDKSSFNEIKMITPEGKEKIVTFSWMKSSLGVELTTANQNDLVLIPFVSGVSVKTQVYLNPKT